MAICNRKRNKKNLAGIIVPITDCLVANVIKTKINARVIFLLNSLLIKF